MKNMVHFGFSAVILIMTILAFLWLNKIQDTNEEVLELIEQFDTKIDLAHTMRTVVTRRYSILLTMLIMDDPFEIDDKVTEFYDAAFAYREARMKLHALPMTKEEKKLHEYLDKVAAQPQNENIQVVEMFRDGAPRKEIEKIIKSARSNQNELLATLDRFVTMQKGMDDEAVKLSKDIFNDSIYWISFFGVIAFIISIVISRYVGHAVAVKNRQLMDAGEEMEQAYLQAEEATVIKSGFLATMSHEIRTPLTAIIGFAETSLFDNQSKEQRQNATKKIIKNGKHLLQIINDILDLSKIEAHKLEVEKVELSLFELLFDIENLVRPAAEDKGLGFSINYIFPLPVKITSDLLRIKQILINLSNNAIKFTEKGYVLINVSSDDAENKLNFEVVDSGIGIKEDKLKTIFKTYQQADTSTTRKFGGTGLGLSLSKELAECLNGSLTVTSTVNKGSKFNFSFAFEPVVGSSFVFDNEHVPQTYEMSKRVKSSNYLDGRILVAEDNKDNQELVSIYLSRMGLDAVFVENGQLAVNASHDQTFDVILMDMRMPIMGGLEATKILREQGFDKPIIALTANAMKEDKKACFDIGCNEFLSKPIDANKLSEILEKYLEKTNKKEASNDRLVSSLFDDGPKTVELISNYVNNFSKTICKIELLLKQTDYADLSELLHQIKGTSGNFGYPSLAAIATKMEEDVLNENIDRLNNNFLELKKTYDKMIIGLESIG